MRHYGNLRAVLQNLYPSTNWDPLKFERQTPNEYLDDVSRQREFLANLGAGLQITEASFNMSNYPSNNRFQLSDWYKVQRKQVERVGKKSLFRSYPSLEAALRAIYPHYEWDSKQFVERSNRSKWVHQATSFQRVLDEVGTRLGVKQVRYLFFFPKQISKSFE